MGHQIEDCSTYTALILLLVWYGYAVFGNVAVIEDNKDRHCYVSNGEIVPAASQDDSNMDAEDAAVQSL